MYSKELPIAELNAFASLLAERVRAYFQDGQHRREFEAWYKERYGIDYVWKDGTA